MAFTKIKRVFTRSKAGQQMPLGDYITSNGRRSRRLSRGESEATRLIDERPLPVALPAMNEESADDGDSNIPSVENQMIEESEYWGPTKEISPAKMIALVTRVTGQGAGLTGVQWSLVDKLCGSYNCAYILDSPGRSRLCVRVPACGFPARWNAHDATLLREVALSMRYIHAKTLLPIPEIISYDTTFENEIGAPYTLMSFLHGTAVLDAWEARAGEDARTTETRRQTILQNIATTMGTLATTVMPRFGALHFATDDAEPVVGNTSRLDTDDIFTIHRRFVPLLSRRSVHDYVMASRARRFADDGFPHKFHAVPIAKGCYELWQVMLDSFLQSTRLPVGEPEFVLMQSDFNPQNILVDDCGRVTGLIDWDCTEAIPRQIGWCSTPHWLQKDWEAGYWWPGPTEDVTTVLAPDALERYRADYTRYLQRAWPGGGVGDARFTRKSHVYRALLHSGEKYVTVKSFVSNVLGDILPRNSGFLDGYVGSVGTFGFRVGEKEWLEGRLLEYFAPEEVY